MKRLFYWLDVAAFLVFATLVVIYSHRDLRFALGMALAAAAFALWMLARVQLGASFSFRAEAKQLVTTGLYAKFRHPIYLFGQVAYLGLAIAWGHAIGFVYVAAGCAIQIPRIAREQAVLEASFGDAYRAYKARTWL